jgi:hypothetical protein
MNDELGTGLDRVRLVRDGPPGELLLFDVYAFAQTANVGHDKVDRTGKGRDVSKESRAA